MMCIDVLCIVRTVASSVKRLDPLFSSADTGIMIFCALDVQNVYADPPMAAEICRSDNANPARQFLATSVGTARDVELRSSSSIITERRG